MTVCKNTVMEVSPLVHGCGACATMDREKMRLKRKENEVRGEWHVDVARLNCVIMKSLK